MVWKRAGVASALFTVGLLVALQVAAFPAVSEEDVDDTNACRTDTGFVRIPTGTKTATGFIFTGTAHQTYLYEVPVVYPGGTFTLSKVGSSSVTVLGRVHPDFDLLVDIGGGNSQKWINDGDDAGTIHPNGVAMYVYMPYGPDPLLIDDNKVDGSAFTFTQCRN